MISRFQRCISFMREGYAIDFIYRNEIFKKNARVLAITVVAVNKSGPPPPPPPPKTIQQSFSTEMTISLSGFFVHCFSLFSLMHLVFVFGFFNVFVFFPLKTTVTGFQKLVFLETKHWTRKRTIKPSLSYFFIHLSISIQFILEVPLLLLPQLFL